MRVIRCPLYRLEVSNENGADSMVSCGGISIALWSGNPRAYELPFASGSHCWFHSDHDMVVYCTDSTFI